MPSEETVRQAQRVRGVGTVLALIGWVAVIAILVMSVILWIEIAGRPSFGLLEAMTASLAAIAEPLVAALILAGFGHALVLFAAYTTDH